MQFQPKDRVALVVVVGDRQPDGKVDVTAEVWARLPFAPADAAPVRVVTFGPFHPPVEQTEALALKAVPFLLQLVARFL